MNLFNLFAETERKTAPIAIYAEDKRQGKEADTEDFPPDIFQVIILMTKRLHQMGVYPEKEIIRLSIPKILEMLEKMDVLSDVSLSTVDTAQIVFGDHYAGWWYQDKTQNPPLSYLVPVQLVFYHQEKADNYFLCWTKDGIDLQQNKVSVTNIHNMANAIKKTEAINLGIKGMAELKSAYHILFIHLKYQILGKMEKLGYRSFVEKFGNAFCPLGGQEALVAYATQYFALNIEKKELYALAHVPMDFQDFFRMLIQEQEIGIKIENSFRNLIKWVEVRIQCTLDRIKSSSGHFELLCHLSDELKHKGFNLWIWSENKQLTDSVVLLSTEKVITGLGQDYENAIVLFSKDLSECYCDEILAEEDIRKIAREFYRVIGVVDVNEMLMEIVGTKILDGQLYANDYLAFFDWKEDHIAEILYGLFSRHGISELIEETAVNGTTLDAMYFQKEERVSPYDRVILYAEPLRRKGKLLFALDKNSDNYQFGIIKNTKESKQQFLWSMDKLAERAEVDAYVLFDAEEKTLFIELLANICWKFDGSKLYTTQNAREKAHRDNEGSMSREWIDRYLSRIALMKNEMTLCFEDGEKVVDIGIKAENGRNFTNLDLLFQIHQGLYQNEHCRASLNSKAANLSHLSLIRDKDKYQIILI